MKKKYQNAFFAFGIAVLAVMVSQLDFAQAWAGLRRAGYWFFAVLALWLFLYMLNTSAWLIIIAGTGRAGKDGPMRRPREINFWWLYKITVSGFALNYTTPCGLMGGEPYRVMALAPRIGTERASASVILYAMTHIFSHLWFWLLSCALYALTQPVNVPMGVMLAAVASLCCVAIWFFIKGYKKGIAVRCMSLLRRFPGLRRRAGAFIERHREQLDTIDSQIAALHNQNPRAFVSAVLLELACRVASALEIFFVLKVITPRADFLECVLMLAFTSLFANMLFFMPLQLGGREGGFLMSARGLALTANAGILVGLIVRVRELVWTAIGLLLIKLDNRRRQHAP